MLARLYISNYALINELEVKFTSGLNTVTGETGAGKSIILGALGLILGKRADLTVLKDNSKKCIVEGVFNIENYQLKKYFEHNDLDYEAQSIFRREITPSGKSRTFINDTPVNLKTIRAFGLKLIDIHSQHQNLELNNQRFQLELIDSVAGTSNLLHKYQSLYSGFLSLKKELNGLKEKAEKANADLDYFQFQFNQLEEANLKADEQEALEQELEKLTHAEEIKSALTQVHVLLDGEEISVLRNIKTAQIELEKISGFIGEAPELAKRLESSFFELKDIAEEAEMIAGSMEFNPQRQEQINERLNLVYSLQQKHNVSTVAELIELKNDFDAKIGTVVGFENEIEKLEKTLAEQNIKLEKNAASLSAKRRNVFPKIIKSVLADLEQLGMPKSKFEIHQQKQPEYGTMGIDAVSFLFSANADAEPNEISKIASGGEMSRLMLSIKNLLRSSKALPTVVFDEIDSGVSGEIGMKMGNIIKSFSSSTQIINITHLPQIAAKGDAHFKVYKYEENGKTYTSLKQLSKDERVVELAKMVGGENTTESTLKTAQELLGK